MVLNEPLERARTIAAALPFINRYRGKRILAKIGGAALVKDQLLEAFATDISLLAMVGLDLIVVHGGGPQIGIRLREKGIPDRKKNGLRITDAATMAVVEEVLCGSMNRSLVAAINAAGAPATGLCGKDDQLLQALRRQDPDIDYGLVGTVSAVNTSAVNALQGLSVPVIAPLGISPSGETLNINADEAAATLAVGLGCEALLMLTDTDGVRDANGQVMDQVGAADLEQLIVAGVIADGMLPKVKFALQALTGGVRSSRILNGETEHALLLELMTDQGAGTMITNACVQPLSSSASPNK